MNIRKSDCPNCGRRNVEGVPSIGFMGKAGYTIGGIVVGGMAGPWGAVAGGVTGAAIASDEAKKYEFKCPGCGTKWIEKF